MTEEELKKHFEDVFKDYEPIGLVPGTTGTYHVGNGMYTGIEGWKMFNRLLKEEAKNFNYDK